MSRDFVPSVEQIQQLSELLPSGLFLEYILVGIPTNASDSGSAPCVADVHPRERCNSNDGALIITMLLVIAKEGHYHVIPDPCLYVSEYLELLCAEYCGLEH
uniref:Uncharacterized protein n=1 Tax=Zea mays TaxID=4577 RepID=A0A804P577_MAIZE